MRQTVPSHIVIALLTCIAIVFFVPNTLQANNPSNHKGDLAISFTFVPADITVDCNAVPGPETPAAQDNCPGDITINLNESSTQTFNGGCADNTYNLIRTWTASNGCGEVATASQTISVFDTQAPTLSSTPPDITLFQSQGATVPVNDVTAFDNCSGNVELTFQEGIGYGACTQLVGRTWIATDACGNATTHTQQIEYIYDWSAFANITPETCSQLGSATVNVNNGTGDYFFFWHPDENNNSPTQGGLAAGTYDMYVVDNISGCKQELVITIPYDCDPNACTANAGTLTANGGVPCQQFLGQAINFSATPNGNMFVPAGYQTTYVLTEGPGLIIQDAQATPNFTVTNPGNYTIHTLVFDPNTLDLGIVQIGITTGFDVNALLQQGGGAICASLDVAGAGVTVAACEVNCTPPIVDNIVIVESTCGNSVGSINITMTTPNTDYSYAWSPNISSSNAASNLASGVYNVIITSNADPACFVEETVVVGNSDGPQGEVVSMTPANCSDASGEVIMGPTNLTFDWGTAGVQDGADPFKRINLFAGDYQVTVTEPGNPCINIINVTVDQINNINGGFIIGLEPDVNQANGQVIITTSNNAGYLYKWSDGVQQNDPNRFDLASGNYCVTICDPIIQGCEDVVCFVLAENNPNCNATIILDASVVSVSCIGDANGNIGFTTDFPAGCIQPPTTEIVDANGNVVANGALSAGNYCVVLSEGNGAIAASECFEVVEPDAIVLDIQPTNVTCFTNGSIMLNVTGGSMSYTFAWSDGSVMEDRVDLNTGTFVVTVTDSNGCQAISPQIVIIDDCQNLCDPPIITNEVVVESTCGDSTGTVEIGLFQNIADYSFTWSPDLGTANAENNARTGVPAGSYTVTIIDNLDPNCGTQTTVVVGNSDGPETTLVATFPATCIESNGTATFLPESFEYTWSDGNPNGQPENMRTDLAAGIYQVTVVDPMGDPACINVIDLEIESASPVGLSLAIVTEPDCGQANGLVIVAANGGAGPYTFAWSDGFVNTDTTQPGTHPDMAAGSYCVTVTDEGNLGCVEELCFVLLNNVPDDACANITLASDTIFTSCIGEGDAMIDFTTDFCANFINPATTEIFSNGVLVNNGSLNPGLHSIIITDGAGCLVGEAVFTVLDSENIDLDIELTPISCIAGGIIEVMASGGSGGYTYTWDPVFPDQATITNLNLGSYSLTVTDANGCTSSASNLTITNACEDCDPFFASDSLVLEIDCDTIGEYITGIPFTEFQNIVVEDNFLPFEGMIVGCEFDSTFCYSTAVIPGGGVMGPYTITDWTVVLDGTEFNLTQGGLNSPDAIANQMNGWDASGNWVFDPVTLTICGGNPNNTYETIFVIQDATGAVGEMDLNINATPQNTCLTFDEAGEHTLVFSDTITGCSDTLELSVICDVPLITRDTLYDTIPNCVVGPFGDLCADTTELPGTIISWENFCSDFSGINVDFTYDEETFCVSYEGIDFGTDPFCLVLCDDLGFCDTTFFIVTVEPGTGTPPVLLPEEVETIKNVPIVVSVAENDVNDNWCDFGIITQPNNGDAQQNEINETITYSPSLDYCGQDQFTYFFSNENGADTTTVFVDVSCECLIIYDGFSPNGDEINDNWIIDGIENFPNNEVCVYNRWGNQVYRKEGYTNNNPFDGTWEANDLPSGTYFYVINTGDGGQVFNGILQINR